MPAELLDRIIVLAVGGALGYLTALVRFRTRLALIDRELLEIREVTKTLATNQGAALAVIKRQTGAVLEMVADLANAAGHKNRFSDLLVQLHQEQ